LSKASTGNPKDTKEVVQPDKTTQDEINPTASASIDDDPILGDKKSAKVGIIEFSDFECPYCQRFESQTFDQIVKDYVDTGKVIFVYRDYPLDFHGAASKVDANAAECVREELGDSKFYDMAKLIYQNTGLNGVGIASDKMISLATQVGAKADGFSKCLASSKFDGEIDNDLKAGSSAGIEGTPGFVVGKLDSNGVVSGELISGAQPYSVFKQAIDRQLQ
jgi:protein-disulfide isomerase